MLGLVGLVGVKVCKGLMGVGDTNGLVDVMGLRISGCSWCEGWWV